LKPLIPVRRLLFIFALSFLAFAAQAQQKPAADLLLILDASGSMWGRAGGEIKIATARKVLKDLASQLPAASQVGLVAYGHRSEGDCADIETVVPMGPLNAANLVGKVEAINPKGKTPLTQSIDHALAAAKGRDKPTTIVLLSDGLETCSGNPCAVVRKAKESGVNFLLHVIGFDLGKENVAPLECAAQAGGGFYFPAANASELSAALEQAVAVTEEAGASVLSVKAVLNGQLKDVSIGVIDTHTGKQIAGGRTYEAAETNPRLLRLPSGTYDVQVRALGLTGDPQQNFKGVTLAKGQTVERIVDFSSGSLAVHVLRNGELSDATVTVFATGTRTQVAGGRSYRAATSNPKVFDITPGVYDVQVGSVEIAGGAVQRFEKVEVKAGERAERKVEYQSGELLIGAKQGANLVDATVTVRSAGNRQEVAGGRTYTAASSNPKQFTLPPGRYVVSVAPVRPAGLGKKEVEVEVVAGKAVEQTVTF